MCSVLASRMFGPVALGAAMYLGDLVDDPRAGVIIVWIARWTEVGNPLLKLLGVGTLYVGWVAAACPLETTS